MSTSIRSSVFAIAIAIASPALAQEPRADGDALDPLRERFREGMDRYRAGAFAEAIVVWEGIYRQLGPEKGYRLAFNLGRAYEQIGDPTRAAEHYESFVSEAARRRATGETLEASVVKQEGEVQERLAELARSRGRIRIATERAVVIAIDGGIPFLAARGYVAYVAPGAHVVTFDPASERAERREIAVGSGAVLDVAPSPPAPVAPPPPVVRVERPAPEAPFHRNVLFVATGVAVVSTIVPILLYQRASDVRARYDATDPFNARDDKVRLGADYDSARSSAYASLAIPITLGVLAAGLTAYWLVATKPTATSFIPHPGPPQTGMALNRF
jgi:hypothetical protein